MSNSESTARDIINPRPVSENNSMEMHGPFHPEDIREGEMIKASIKSKDITFEFKKEMRVWKLSPLGIELLVTAPDEILPKGLAIDLTITIGRQEVEFSGLVVDYITEKMNRNFICVRLTQEEIKREDGIERRQAARWSCSPQYFPTCVAANPAKYNDFLYFLVKDLSKDGIQLSTSLRNKFILVGMTFEALISFPMIGQTKIKFRVKNVRVISHRGIEQLMIGCEFISISDSDKELIAQYIVQFSNVNSISELKSLTNKLPSISKALSFSYVRTEDEYRQVLELRHKAYLAAGKISALLRPQEMADVFDAKSRIVIGKYHGRVIASCRLTFSDYDDRMEQENYVQWPTDLPRRDECVEMMRLCTDPDFRGSDIITPMFQFMALAIIQSKRRWVLICATEDMKHFYKKIGFINTNLSYPHAKLNNKIHHIMYADVAMGMLGHGIGPIFWNIVWRDVSEYMRDFNLITPDPLANLRISIYRMFAPIAYYFKNKYKSPRKLISK